MEYKRIFSPNLTEVFPKTGQTVTRMGDRCDKSVYVYNEKIILAVNVAIVTGRPLLVRGPSGCGKSSLAKNVSKVLGWRYYRKIISSQTQAKDLLYEVDLLRRLQDAQTKMLNKDFSVYINPNILWWAFDLDSARMQRVSLSKNLSVKPPKEPDGCSNHSRAVVLLDEIDKADPDVPNNLLDPLGSLQFQVEEMNVEIICKERPLIIITTNDERDLPPAFLRRCVDLKLENPLLHEMIEIGKAHFDAGRLSLLEKVANLLEIKDAAPSSVSPAEFIDTIQACIDLEISLESESWEMLKKVTIFKQDRGRG